MLRCCLVLGLTACEQVFPLEVDPISCPDSYVPIGVRDSKYRLDTTNSNWFEAEALCAADRGLDGSTSPIHLLVLGDMEELDAVPNIASNQELWIGFTDQNTEGSFHWITGEDDNNDFAKAPRLPPWDVGEPNDAAGENCAVLKGNLLLNDSNCTTVKFHFVCECDRREVTIEL